MFHVKHRGDYMDNYMNIALDEAKIAFKEGNVPVGAVIVKENNIIAFNHNKKNSDNVSIFHAELLCIVEACKTLGSWYLDDCIMYVTLKPCKMCEAAIAESRIKKVYYLLESNYSENMNYNISNIDYVKVNNISEYDLLLSDFFINLRSSNVSRETLE